MRVDADNGAQAITSRTSETQTLQIWPNGPGRSEKETAECLLYTKTCIPVLLGREKVPLGLSEKVMNTREVVTSVQT